MGAFVKSEKSEVKRDFKSSEPRVLRSSQFSGVPAGIDWPDEKEEKEGRERLAWVRRARLWWTVGNALCTTVDPRNGEVVMGIWRR